VTTTAHDVRDIRPGPGRGTHLVGPALYVGSFTERSRRLGVVRMFVFAAAAQHHAGLGTLVSSKVNQWALLVGTVPIVFAIASGSLDGLPIVSRQREELFLTAAQSVFAVAILTNFSISVKEAGLSSANW
jgi:hypothetical protein